MISVLFNLLRFALWRSIWAILVNVLQGLEKMCIWLLSSGGSVPIRYCWLLVLIGPTTYFLKYTILRPSRAWRECGFILFLSAPPVFASCILEHYCLTRSLYLPGGLILLTVCNVFISSTFLF